MVKTPEYDSILQRFYNPMMKKASQSVKLFVIYLSSVKFGMIFGRSVSFATFQDVLYIHSVIL